AKSIYYEVLIQISLGYPPVKGRLHTRYAPVRRSSASASTPVTPRLACVKPAASVHPEPGSNSSSLIFKCYLTTNRNSFNQVLKMAYSLVCFTRFQLYFTLSIQYVYELVSFIPYGFYLFCGCKYLTLFLSMQLFLSYLEKIF